MEKVLIKRVTEDWEIEGIKALEVANNLVNISMEESDKEGFVTASYSIELLRKMNEIQPSIIALYENKVVGYAMVTDKELYGQHTLLDSLFDALVDMNYQGKKLGGAKVVLVGQLCVAKPFRGKGLVPKMYNFFKECLITQYDYCVTDISEANPRSIRAHEKCGFKIIDTLEYEGVKWYIVMWDWINNGK
jgi:GNAT superfamily N-acetyltransferase